MTTTVGSKTRQLEIAPTDNCEDESCRTFVLHNEDHTLGNALRYMIMKKLLVEKPKRLIRQFQKHVPNPEVDLCGYSVPHPSEKKINLRIQTRGAPAPDVLKQGLSQLMTVCDHIRSTFELNVGRYKELNPASEPMDI